MSWFNNKKKDSISQIQARLEAAIIQLSFYRAENAEIKVANKALCRELHLSSTKISLLEESLNEAVRRLRNV
jgi:hypothetical protein